MPTISRRTLLPLMALAALAGCTYDSASYSLDETQNRVILLQRSQAWLWEDHAKVVVQVFHKPECVGGGEIEAVPLTAEMELFRPPDVYAEPLHILRIGNDYWAISTLSCRIQKFADTPEDLGVRVGVFRPREGVLRFEPDTPGGR